MNPEDEGRAAAKKFRDDHRLGVQPIGDLITLIEQTTGIDVAVVDAGNDEHGMAMKDPDRGFVIVAVARTPHPMRQRSSLAHELAHVLFEDWDDPSKGGWRERDGFEQRADSFARHLLIPRGGLVDTFPGRSSLSLDDLSAAVQRFLVSPMMATIAFYGASLVDAQTKAAWMSYSTPALATRFGWSDRYRALAGEADQTRAPQRLVARAVEGYLENVVSLAALARLRGVPESQVEEEMAAAGLHPSPVKTEWAQPGDLPTVDVDLSDLEEVHEGDRR